MVYMLPHLNEYISLNYKMKHIVDFHILVTDVPFPIEDH